LKNQNKHILILASEFPPQPGGIGNHAYNLAKSLEANNFKVSVIADQRSELGYEEQKFDSELHFSMHRVKLTRIRAFMYIKRVVLLFKHIKHTQIVIASGKFPLWIVAFCSLFYKKIFIAIVHGSEVNFTNKFLNTSINHSLKQYSKIIAVSNYTKSLLSDFNKKKTVVIPNGLDVNNWKASNLPALQFNGTPNLITVGNVTERKGQLNVIKLLPDLISIYPNLQYHCVGIPTQKETFLQVAKNLKVESFITFHGRVSNRKLEQLLKASDIFVMLSSPTNTGDVEGFGIALLEANYLGLPCIGSKNCGIEDAIDNYKSGVLIQHNSSKDFVVAIQEILNNYTNYNVNAKKWAKQHDWSLIIKKYIKEFSL
jgi:phosphatidylinositol alpha-1,6-mannosyltransferase